MRSVIVARYYLDWSTPQIAEGLDIPLGTVKSRLNRALQRLSEELGGTP
jgi:RNA polymerase sigma-70 factor (ECF subfamily)